MFGALLGAAIVICGVIVGFKFFWMIQNQRGMKKREKEFDEFRDDVRRRQKEMRR